MPLVMLDVFTQHGARQPKSWCHHWTAAAAETTTTTTTVLLRKPSRLYDDKSIAVLPAAAILLIRLS